MNIFEEIVIALCCAALATAAVQAADHILTNSPTWQSLSAASAAALHESEASS